MVLDFLKRTWIELCLLALIGVLLYNASLISHPALQLFLFKVMLFSASQVHAMIMRKLFFAYIDFSKGDPSSRALVIAIHVSSAYLYAQGG